MNIDLRKITNTETNLAKVKTRSDPRRRNLPLEKINVHLPQSNPAYNPNAKPPTSYANTAQDGQRIESCWQMKHLLLTTIAAVVLVGVQA